MGVKSNRVEGSTKLNNVIRQLGYNKDVTVRLGTVKAPPPSVVIKADNIAFDLEADDLIISDYLLDHERVVSISGGSVSGSVSGDHTLNSFTLTDGTMTINSPLTTGTRVVILDDESSYYVVGIIGEEGE